MRLELRSKIDRWLEPDTISPSLVSQELFKGMQSYYMQVRNSKEKLGKVERKVKLTVTNLNRLPNVPENETNRSGDLSGTLTLGRKKAAAEPKSDKKKPTLLMNELIQERHGIADIL